MANNTSVAHQCLHGVYACEAVSPQLRVRKTYQSTAHFLMRTFLSETMLICQLIHNSSLRRLSAYVSQCFSSFKDCNDVIRSEKKSLGFNFLTHLYLGLYISLSFFKLLLPIVPFQFLPSWEDDHLGPGTDWGVYCCFRPSVGRTLSHSAFLVSLTAIISSLSQHQVLVASES